MKKLILSLACAFSLVTPVLAQGTLAPLDIPPIDLTNHSTNGGVTGLLPITSGGTGADTLPNISSLTLSQVTAVSLSAAVGHAYLIDTTSNACAVTLPTAVGAAGQTILVLLQVKGGSHVVTMASTSSQTVNGVAASGFGLSTVNHSFTFMSDGANWVVSAST